MSDFFPLISDPLQLPNVLRAEAKTVLENGMGEVIAAIRSALGVAKEIRVQAIPVLSLIETAQREIDRFNKIQGQIDDALSRLEPYKSVPEVATAYQWLTAIKPFVSGMIAIQTSQQLLAALAVPDPTALGAAALVTGIDFLEAQVPSMLQGLSSFLDS